MTHVPEQIGATSFRGWELDSPVSLRPSCADSVYVFRLIDYCLLGGSWCSCNLSVVSRNARKQPVCLPVLSSHCIAHPARPSFLARLADVLPPPEHLWGLAFRLAHTHAERVLDDPAAHASVPRQVPSAIQGRTTGIRYLAITRPYQTPSISR
ncbi:hypothetical protein C8Q76DRAFT_123567 [Earliella scabrosa]|nr:hypothetical protein C8Q76DRAFT_123567 [Earliella scabrosa]